MDQIQDQKQEPEIKIVLADESHVHYVDEILETIAAAAKVRGTGIAKRNPEYVKQKMIEGKAVLALCGDDFAGFSYIETWDNKQYVTTSGLIVPDRYRGRGLARRIKHMTFSLARARWPEAKIFSLTSGAAVMKLNTQHGYKPVTFAQLTNDESFWHGCEGCVNFDVLQRTDRRYCICTGMLFDPNDPDCLETAQKELDLDPTCRETIEAKYGPMPPYKLPEKESKTLLDKIKSLFK